MTRISGPSPARTDSQSELHRLLASALAGIDACFDEPDDEKREARSDEIEPLCVMPRVELTVQLAWGGPEYGFRLRHDPESRQWIDGTFYRADWGEFAEEQLTADELDRVVQVYSLDCFV